MRAWSVLWLGKDALKGNCFARGMENLAMMPWHHYPFKVLFQVLSKVILHLLRALQHCLEAVKDQSGICKHLNPCLVP
jgi:hypothetical protein